MLWWVCYKYVYFEGEIVHPGSVGWFVPWWFGSWELCVSHSKVGGVSQSALVYNCDWDGGVVSFGDCGNCAGLCCGWCHFGCLGMDMVCDLSTNIAKVIKEMIKSYLCQDSYSANKKEGAGGLQFDRCWKRESWLALIYRAGCTLAVTVAIDCQSSSGWFDTIHNNHLDRNWILEID